MHLRVNVESQNLEDRNIEKSDRAETQGSTQKKYKFRRSDYLGSQVQDEVQKGSGRAC